MGGAALMSNLFMALVKSGYVKPLTLVIPVCENLVAERSMKPGSIHKSHKGLTVAVDHTDAKGRLIFADALSYRKQKLKPALTMTSAKIKTAALRQFTGYYMSVHFANPQFIKKLQESVANYGEGFVFWSDFLPFKWANKEKVTDLTNMGRFPAASSIGG